MDIFIIKMRETNKSLKKNTKKNKKKGNQRLFL